MTSISSLAVCTHQYLFFYIYTPIYLFSIQKKTMSTSNGSTDDVERRSPSPVIVEDASEDDEEGYPSMSMRTSSRHTATDEFSPQSHHSSNSHYHKPAQSSFDDIQNARSSDSGKSHNSQYSGAGGNNRYVQTNFSNNSNNNDNGRSSSYQDAENTPAFSNASSSHIHRGGSSSFQQDQNMNTPAYSNVSANVNRSYSHASRGSRGSNKSSSNRRTKTAAPTPAPTPKVTEAPSMSSIKFKMVSESPPAKIGPFCGCF